MGYSQMFGPCINCSVRAVSLSAGRQARTARAVTVAWHSVQARQVSQAKAAESFDWQGPQARQQKTSAGRIAENLPALAARDWLRSSLEAYSCRVAGVSFEGRQVWISKLEAEQPVEFRHEPDNPYDSNAVKILTLGGTHLGYVPRTETAHFKFPITFGCVSSLGPAADTGLFGVQVRTQPSLPPLTVEAFPANLAPMVNLSAMLSGADWERLTRKAYSRSDHRCEVTGGVGSAWPVECQEVWEFDDKQHVLRLTGMTALAPEVHLAKHILQLQGQQRASALQTLQDINGWRPTDAEIYLESVAELARTRTKHKWLLDLAWLQGEGAQVPSTSNSM